MSTVAELSARLAALEARVELLASAPVPTRRPTLACVVAVVAQEFGVTPAEIIGDARSRDIVRARQAAVYVGREVTQRSSTVLGRYFQRDHSTILYTIATARALTSQDDEFARRCDAARHTLRDRSGA